MSPPRKFSYEQARFMFDEMRMTQTRIARHFGVHSSVIKRAVVKARKERYQHQNSKALVSLNQKERE